MHFLISGGTGLIGRQLCHHFTQQGHQVSVLSRQCAHKVQEICGASVNTQNHCHEIDPTTHIDAIINLAGAPITDKRWRPARKKILINSRISITRQLVELTQSLTQPPELMISGSAVGFYGNQADNFLVESSPPQEDFAHQLCADWEAAAHDGLPTSTRLCTLRTGLVLSKQGGMLKKLLPAFKWGGGAVLGDGTQWMPWIHIDDMVNIIDWIISHPNLTGPVNAVAPHPVTNQSFTRELGKALSRPTWLSAPEPVLKFALGEMASLLLASQRAIPEKLLHSGFQFKFNYLDKALTYELNGKP